MQTPHLEKIRELDKIDPDNSNIVTNKRVPKQAELYQTNQFGNGLWFTGDLY